MDRLLEAEYGSVRVLAVDVPAVVAHDQARARWWAGRLRWRDGTDVLGGRFVPPSAIDACFDVGVSTCVRNARELESAYVRQDIHVTVERYERTASGVLERST